MKLYAVKVLDKKGEGDLYSLLRGIDWAITNKMDIINLSLGFEDNIPILRSAVDEAYKKDCSWLLQAEMMEKESY